MKKINSKKMFKDLSEISDQKVAMISKTPFLKSLFILAMQEQGCSLPKGIFSGSGEYDKVLYSEEEYIFIIYEDIQVEGYSLIAIPAKTQSKTLSSYKILPFFKMVKKDFVEKMVKLKNKKSEVQKRMKRFFRKIENKKLTNYMQSAIDKTSNDLNSLHFTISYLYGKDNEKALTEKEKKLLINALLQMKNS